MLYLLIIFEVILFLCFLQVDHLYLMLHVERVHDLGSLDHHDALSLFLAASPDVSELLFSLELKLSLFDKNLLDCLTIEMLSFFLFNLQSYILIIFF